MNADTKSNILEELIETIGDVFMQTYSLRVAEELTYIVVIGDCEGSELELKASSNISPHALTLPGTRMCQLLTAGASTCTGWSVNREFCESGSKVRKELERLQN